MRTLVHDLGERLGCGAVLRRLRRLASGPFNLERALELEELTGPGGVERVREKILGLGEILADRPGLAVDGRALDALMRSRRYDLAALRRAGLDPAWVMGELGPAADGKGVRIDCPEKGKTLILEWTVGAAEAARIFKDVEDRVILRRVRHLSV